jgi:sulfonate transport system substrate-binding protein
VTPAPASAPTLAAPFHVRVSDTNDVAAAPIYIALEQGYFWLEALDVELVSVSQAVVVQAVTTNQLQFGLTLPSPSLFNALGAISR